MNTQPTLQGETLQLRPLQPDDFDALYAVASDPLIWEQHPARDRYQRDVFQQFFADALASGGALVVLNNTGEIIGSSRYHAFNPETRQVEIGWTFLSRAYWGGPTNTELKALMLNHAFQHVDRVLFLIGPDNLRSRRAVEKLGAVLVGERPNTASSLIYALERPE